MSPYEVHPDGTALLATESDGEQHVWTVTRDGGMVTRGTYAGVRSAGIQWLYDQGAVTVLWSPTDHEMVTRVLSKVRDRVLTLAVPDDIEAINVEVGARYRHDPRHEIRVQFEDAPDKIRLPPVPEVCVCGNRFDGPNLCMIGACEQET
jgi:hypothetical protein